MKKASEFSSHKLVKRKKFWGLLEYKPRWGLTMLAWIIILFVLTLSTVIAIAQIHPFLAVSNTVEDAELLILEGWADDFVVEGAVNEFNQGNYSLILTTGGPLDKGSYLAQYKSFAELAAATITALKISPDRVVALPTPDVKKDRTAASAKVVKQWLAQSNLQIQRVNLYSYDAHTRRSWWIFKKILEPEIKVGAIAHPSISYNSKDWFESSAGMRSIISETIAYLYARFIWKA